jgi:hypothetical protein
MTAWAQSFGSKLLFVDGSEERLMRHVGLFQSASVVKDADGASEKMGESEQGRNFTTAQSPPHISATEATTLEVHPVTAFLTPELLRTSELLDDFDTIDVLKVDIDSIDCEVLRAILSRVKPAVIVVEVATKLPPPFRYSLFEYRNSSNLLEGGHDFVGCSLSYQVHLLEPAFTLLLFTGMDAVFVHRELAPTLEKLPAGRLFPWTSWPLRFPVDEVDCFRRALKGIAYPEWISVDPAEVFADIWDRIVDHGLGPFSLSY